MPRNELCQELQHNQRKYPARLRRCNRMGTRFGARFLGGYHATVGVMRRSLGSGVQSR
ncbi:MAG: hypothetical protein JXA33_03470 [Anaerolineae bacterium]|nr:hypothetical protein [Anaerolineae bacterium]